MRYILLLLLVAGCRDNPKLTDRNPKCGQPCYGGQAKHDGVGACQPGRWNCDEDQEDPVCLGWVAPSNEVCNGVDDDCNGVVDLNIEICSNTCGSGKRVCMSGMWSECDARKPTVETCNNKDDDCDGIVDNPEQMPLEFCYSGPVGSVGLGDCHPGVVLCAAGTKYCKNEKIPTAEKCDHVDNDCDGKIDEDFTNTQDKFDLVFIFDDSGSMQSYIDNMKYITSNWSSKYGSDLRFQFAIVTAPDGDYSYGDAPRLFQNLTDANTFAIAVSQQYATGSGTEATLDAIVMVLDSANPFGIAWRPGSKRSVIIFSDEEPQSIATPPLKYADVATVVNAANVPVIAFTTANWTLAWNATLPAPNGSVKDITMPAATMNTVLDDLVNFAVCQ